MKKLLVKNSIIAILIVLIVGLMVVGCFPSQEEEVLADKTALEAEIALEITEQGDYTESSYSEYAKRLAEAKAVVADKKATQEAVDKITSALTAARNALTIRPIELVKGANKEFRIISGESKEIVLDDIINVNNLSKITYSVKTSNEVITLSSVADGKFTMTAGEVSESTVVKVSIVVSYDGVNKLGVELTVHITNDSAPIIFNEELVKEYDLFDLTNKDSLVIDFAENVDNAGNLELAYSVIMGNEELVLNGTLYTLTLGSYSEEYAYTMFTVTVSYTANGEENTLTYTYKLGLRDTSAYRVANGDFENGLDGWTMTDLEGEVPFGAITDAPTFWDGYPMFNVGKYFSGIAEGAGEASHGTLASPYFIAKGQYATYMLGSAGNENVYITIENEAGEVLAVYRNTEFADLPSGEYTIDDYREMIGNTVFALNFVTYKVDISAYAGLKIRFVVHDHASSSFGFACFDELNSYYASAEEVPENAVLAENLLASKDALNAEIALEVKEQGDYTLDSFNTYLEKLAIAKALAADVGATQEKVDEAIAALKDARAALTVRPVEEIAGVNKAFNLISGSVKEIVLDDFINTNGLSNITYEVEKNSELVTLGSVVDGKFTIKAGEVSKLTPVKVTINVSYMGETKLSVELTVTITNDIAPTLFNNEVVKNLDMFVLENKTNMVLDLAENVDNAGNLALTYSVNGEALEGSTYTFAFGSYTDVVTNEAFTVTVSYVANGEKQSISYEYKLAIKDSTTNRLVNGGFENGIEGWTVVGNIGGIATEKTYWTEAIEFGMDGERMFSAYAPGALESAVGTLTSSSFKVGGSGFVTFKIGAMRDGNYVYIDVVDASTKQILARYYNGLWVEENLSGCKLIAYKADLSAFAGKEVFFRISDNADSGYGLFFADSFVTYYENEPEGFETATPVSYEVSGTIYDVFNGGFEMGDVQGWWNAGEPGKVTNADAFFSGVAYGKNGTYLYSGVEDFQAGNGREGNRGVLTSSAFELGGNGYISFMLGGGGNELCYVQVIDAVTNELLARYHQQEMEDAVLKQYVADLSAYIGRTVRVQVVDYAENNWGCVSFDNLVTYHTSIPEGITANDIKGGLKHTIDNGSFETGNLDGWSMNITEAGAHNTIGWVLETEIDAGWYTKNDETKDGKFLFTFAQPGDINCENTKGTLQSSTFSLKQGAFVSFKFGAAGGAQNHDVYVELCRADGSVIARFYNDAPGKVNTRMNSYYYQYNGAEVNCFFRVVDNSTGDYGCVVVDDFRVNLESAPEGFIEGIQ